MGKKLKTLSTVAIVAGASYTTYKLIAQKLFDYTFKRVNKDDKWEHRHLDWYKASKRTDLKMNSYDGLKLHAVKIENNDTDKYVIMVHGIWSNGNAMIDRAYEFDKLGYNILMVDQRASGESEGKYYTYGFKEGFDINQWINYLVKRNKDCKIMLYGVSMGAATVMQTTNNVLPDNVRCIVEDCGFSSLKEELAHILKKDYKILKPNIVLNFLQLQMSEEIGLKFSDVSAKRVLNDNEIPLLIIHGEDDDFVPFDMAKIIYNNNKGYKKYYPVKNAKHGKAAANDEKYYQHVNEFAEKFMC